MNRLFRTMFIAVTLLSVSVRANENDIAELFKQLEKIPSKNYQLLNNKYADGNGEFREEYTLTADIRMFNLKLGQITLGNVVISSQDSFSITYDPPFEKWDTRYLSYWQNDSVFVDEVIGQVDEKIIYHKNEGKWILIAYESKKPRKNKQIIFQDGLTTPAPNLIEVTRLLNKRKFEDISEVLFLAEIYPIRLKAINSKTTNYSIYRLKWKVSEGDEKVRLHGVYLVGIETEKCFIPVGGILKVSFVGLLDVNLIGVIQ